MDQNTSIALTEMDEYGVSFHPSMRFEDALTEIRETYQAPLLSKVPFSEIAALGASFSGVINTLATPAAEGIYRCVFPRGVTGALAMAKDGSGALGTIMNESGIVGQARWIPVDKAIGPACLQAAVVAVAVLAVVKQISDIKEGQKEIISILECDKKSQLIADYDILADYMENYRYYWDNEATVVVNLNQVKNIKRNAKKDILSYVEQIEGYIAAKKNLLTMQTASYKIGQLLDRFVHYKLALNVFSVASYMEVMLSKNFSAEFLAKTSEELRECSFKYRELYTQAYEKIEALKTEAVTAQTAKKAAKLTKSVGEFIGSIPLIKEGPVDEFLIGVGESIDEAEKNRLEATLAFFAKHKDSVIIPIADHIEMVNRLANKPTVLLYDKNVISFSELQAAV